MFRYNKTNKRRTISQATHSFRNKYFFLVGVFCFLLFLCVSWIHFLRRNIKHYLEVCFVFWFRYYYCSFLAYRQKNLCCFVVVVVVVFLAYAFTHQI